MSVSTEVEDVRGLYDTTAKLERIARSLPQGDHRRDELAAIARGHLAAHDPVRAAVAAKLLRLSAPTVRAWAKEGVLIPRGREPRLTLDTARLYDVVQLVVELRDAGQQTGLLDEVYRRLTDAPLLADPDLHASLEQVRRGEGTIVAGPAVDE